MKKLFKSSRLTPPKEMLFHCTIYFHILLLPVLPPARLSLMDELQDNVLNALQEPEKVPLIRYLLEPILTFSSTSPFARPYLYPHVHKFMSLGKRRLTLALVHRCRQPPQPPES